jgi:(E)-4-hydroxy-3-methylbut-2-enyl-diphosphate synthase
MQCSRFKTRIVNIGDVPLGGDYPIRIQSMTTTDTMDTLTTVEQSIRIIKAGADYVRITAPSTKEAENLLQIKNELRKKGYITPLIADIHYTPNAAEIAARIVEKVRINPGNYIDKKKFEFIEYTDEQYNLELEKIFDKFSPLVKICKKHGTAMRIGTNHGSLSDRIMSRYGDTPLGMVESAIEFIKICEELNYHDIVLSMKSSNPQVMVQAYRVLVNRMIELGMNYPLHLGVTEAGGGEDGRIKSSIGIGTLLNEGLGDTIRVSLTEDPEFEIPVCQKIIERYDNIKTGNIMFKIPPAGYSRRESLENNFLGGKKHPVVIVTADDETLLSFEGLKKIGYHYSESPDKWNISDDAPDFLYTGDEEPDFKLPGTVKQILNFKKWIFSSNKQEKFPLFTLNEFSSAKEKHPFLNFVEIGFEDLSGPEFRDIIGSITTVLILKTDENNIKTAFEFLKKAECRLPVIIKKSYFDIADNEKFIIDNSIDAGSMFLDGLGDGIWLESKHTGLDLINSCSFGILQAVRLRISKTEYISCPSCGRTLFNLQETTEKIRQKTSHLKGLKIAVMGCIVNGPGEMADADYGYVGSGIGKVSLYKGKEIMKKNIKTSVAVDELIKLINDNGDWAEPKN